MENLTALLRDWLATHIAPSDGSTYACSCDLCVATRMAIAASPNPSFELISEPGAAIRVEAYEMPDHVRRAIAESLKLAKRSALPKSDDAVGQTSENPI